METTESIANAVAQSSIPTVLFLGAGASIGSGAPSAANLAEFLRTEHLPHERPRELSDISGRIELMWGRTTLTKSIRSVLSKLTPSAALSNLPNFNFSSIFTTNYDTLVEKSFEQSKIDIPVIRSNKDSAFDHRQYNTILYKLHGCITEDRADGLSHGMIITSEDYQTYDQYRQIGFRQFDQSLATSNVIFVGFSMSDANIREYVERALKTISTQECPGKIFLILFEEDEIDALRWENRGLRVAFGDLDSLLNSLATTNEDPRKVSIFSPITSAPRYQIAAEISSIFPSSETLKKPNLRRLVSGGELSYADIYNGYAFPRSAAREIVQQMINQDSAQLHVLLGPSGSGRTSAARMAAYDLMQKGFACYEHKSNIGIDFATWKDVDLGHQRRGERAVLVLDEPNASQFAVNQLASFLQDGNHALSLIIAYHPSIWSFRTKSPALVKKARIHPTHKLTPSDISGIVNHVRKIPDIAKLLDRRVQALSNHEIEQIVSRRAKSDLFVSLKFLFESKSLDEIILKEFDRLGRFRPKSITSDILNIYKIVALLEASGRHVHRQMVLRLCELEYGEIAEILDYFDGVLIEFERDSRVEGAYVWKTRHPKIAAIIAESKFSTKEKIDIFENIIRTINPASKIERQFCAVLCSSEIGIESLAKSDQTQIYQLLCDALPGERVPRHRLIRNLIREKRFGEAEIAIAESRDSRINDSVIFRYDVDLNVAKAEHLDFLDANDKNNLLETAVGKATNSVSRRPQDMHNYDSLCKASLAYALNGGDHEIFYSSVETLKAAFQEIGDELMVTWIAKYESEAARLRRKERE